MSIQLRFRPDQSFTILQFTDIHWQNGDAADLRSRALMARALDHEQPDLVVFTGDLIESLLCHDPKASLLAAVAAAEERQIPWAAVFGNHDSEKGSRQELADAIRRECRYSLFQPGPPRLHGVGNYWLPVHTASGGSQAATLWFFDSGAYAPLHFGVYEWIHWDQIRWYKRESARLTAAHGRPLPSLAFFHIPLPEYSRVWRTQVCSGQKLEKVCCPWFNSGLFRAMVGCKDVIGTFCGHDHINDYCGELNSIRLCYGRATGYNTYGREGFPRGARVIRLTEGKRRFKTWLHLDQPEAGRLEPAAERDDPA